MQAAKSGAAFSPECFRTERSFNRSLATDEDYIVPVDKSEEAMITSSTFCKLMEGVPKGLIFPVQVVF